MCTRPAKHSQSERVALARNNRGAADLVVRPRVNAPKALARNNRGSADLAPLRRPSVEKAITGVRLYTEDAIRLRALRRDKTLNVAKFLRGAIHDALTQLQKDTD